MAAMRAEGGNVKLAVLNACFSEVQAKHLMAHIPCVIGMPDLIGDKAGIVYAAYVYRALASGKSVAKAHQHGIAALALHRSHGPSRDVEPTVVPTSESQVSHPMLLTRSEIDADHIYIVHGAEDTAPQMRIGHNQQKAVCILTVKATLREFDEHVIARVRAELRQLSSDVILEIIDIDEGSVRLSLSLSAEAVKVLQEKRTNGKLPEISGFEVLALELREGAELGMTAHVDAEQVSAGMVAQERKIIHAILRTASTGSGPTSAWIESTLNLAASTGTGSIALTTYLNGHVAVFGAKVGSDNVDVTLVSRRSR